jgi:hypothetical protein
MVVFSEAPIRQSALRWLCGLPRPAARIDVRTFSISSWNARTTITTVSTPSCFTRRIPASSKRGRAKADAAAE